MAEEKKFDWSKFDKQVDTEAPAADAEEVELMAVVTSLRQTSA